MQFVSDYTDHSASCFFPTNIIFLRSHIDMYLGLGKFSYCCADFDSTNIPQFSFQYSFFGYCEEQCGHHLLFPCIGFLQVIPTTGIP